MGFATELKALLIKYNATIEADYDGDSHGINNEKIVVTATKRIWTLSGCY